MSTLLAAMRKSIGSREQRNLRASLRQLRKATGLSQADVAHQLRVPQSFVSRYESGERRLDLVELLQICRVFGISLAEFVKQFEERLRDATKP